MAYLVGPLAFLLFLWFGMLLLLEIGRRLGMRHKEQATGSGFGAIEGAVFGLLGLLIAFTFSGAAARFDTRRALIVEEANDIGTAYLRLDLLPPAAQPPLRNLFRSYVDARLDFYHTLSAGKATTEQIERFTQIQNEIWGQSVAASQQTGTTAGMLLLPALNQMFDITTTRLATLRMHPPPVIFAMLGGLALACSLLAGYGMAASPRSWVHTLGFAIILTVAVYVIIDLEYPRYGLIRVDSFDQVLVDVRNGMK